ncbi:hypothetical protein AAF712_016782 [Marasmius tenuissimus]|uniref:Uncharacterized protein n=1 Tax=Marasmius tenuissimus TaxID=585030 RepID=A0ABR2Z750_9AGAR
MERLGMVPSQHLDCLELGQCSDLHQDKLQVLDPKPQGTRPKSKLSSTTMAESPSKKPGLLSRMSFAEDALMQESVTPTISFNRSLNNLMPTSRISVVRKKQGTRDSQVLQTRPVTTPLLSRVSGVAPTGGPGHLHLAHGQSPVKSGMASANNETVGDITTIINEIDTVAGPLPRAL